MNSTSETLTSVYYLSSSTIAFITSLQIAQRYLFRCGGPFFILVGTISSVLSLIVFTQKGLRKNPCSIYFIAYSIAILVLIYISFLPITLEIGYNLTPTNSNLFLCRLRLYATFLMNCLCPFYLLLASVDRVLVTSPNARTRQLSTCRLAYMTIGIGTLIWIFGLSHVLIFSALVRIDTGEIICYLQLGWYSAAISYASLVKEILIPSLMGIFGILSIKQIRNIRINIVPVSTSGITNATGNNYRLNHTKDRQLIRMLLVDITIYIFFSLLLAFNLMYEEITRETKKSLEQFQIEVLIKAVAMFAAHIPFCINSYAKLIVSKTFRTEVKEILIWKRANYSYQQRYPSTR